MSDLRVVDSQVAELEAVNERFLEAFRIGSWDALAPLLSRGFVYLDGDTGEEWPRDRYVNALDGHPSPGLTFDQLHIRISGDVATVSARTHRDGGAIQRRFIDTYLRSDGWRCVHACVWTLSSGSSDD